MKLLKSLERVAEENKNHRAKWRQFWRENNALPTGIFRVDAGKARKLYTALSRYPHKLVFYESPYRVLQSLHIMREVFGAERQVALIRETRKAYKTLFSGSLPELVEMLARQQDVQAGPLIIVVDGYVSPPRNRTLAPEVQQIMQILLENLPAKQAASVAAKLTGETKSRLYNWALQVKSPEKLAVD